MHDVLYFTSFSSEGDLLSSCLLLLLLVCLFFMSFMFFVTMSGLIIFLLPTAVAGLPVLTVVDDVAVLSLLLSRFLAYCYSCCCCLVVVFRGCTAQLSAWMILWING